MEFIYKDAKGQITHRKLDDYKEDETHFSGICTKANDLRTFRKDRVLEWISDPDVAKERLSHHIQSNPPPELRDSKRNLEGKPEICFTGFKKADKDRLIAFAKENGIHVASGITKKLFGLCCGYNRGPAKVEKAIANGAYILSEKQLENLVKTGEVPSE